MISRSLSPARLLRSSTFAARAAIALAFAASAVGCTVDARVQELATTESTIIDGVPSGVEDNSAVWVGVLSSEGYPMGSCSGVLVADNLVLTARHCVARTQGGGVACSKDGKPISGGNVLRDYPAEQLAIVIGPTMTRKAAARGKQVFTTGVNNLCNNDFALVVLDRRIPNAQIAPLRLDAPPKKGEKILAVGWGVSNNSRTYGRRRRADIPILGVGPMASTATGSIASNEFAIGEGICQGDSGGPAYSMETGAVLGVVSRGGNGYPESDTDPAYINCVDMDGYTTHNIYTRVDTLKTLVLEAFAAAESEPWYEGGPDPRKLKLGVACESGDACRSGICADTPEGNVCADPCGAEGQSCPEGYVCSPHRDSKVCLKAPPPAPANEGAPSPPKKGCSVSSARSGADDAAPIVFGVAAVLALHRRRRA